MNQQIIERPSPTEKEIATRAYYLWESNGRPAGRDLEFWMKAKSQLTERQRPVTPANAPNTQANPNIAENGEKQPRKPQKIENRTKLAKQAAYA